MAPALFMLAAFALSAFAGAFGAVLGLGGGIIVVPALTMLLGVDIRHAIGASLVAVVATSCSAGASYARSGLANVRVAVLLETGTTVGALAGALLAGAAPPGLLFGAFGVLLAATAFTMWRRPHDPEPIPGGAGRLAGSVPGAGPNGAHTYDPVRPGAGVAASAGAGLISGLLGVGGGIVMVPVMALAMRMPLKAAAATSAFMIGVTGAASAGVYYARGDVLPLVAAPVALGVLLGAHAGARALPRLSTPAVRAGFTVLLVLVAIRMLARAFA